MTAATAPPHSIEAESAVLAALLVSEQPMHVLVAEEGLTPADFFRPRYRAVFGVMTELHDEGRPVDRVTVGERLRAGGEDVVVLDEVAGSGFSAARVREYARIIRGLSRRRSLAELGRQIGGFAEESERDEDQARALALEALDLLGGHGGARGPVRVLSSAEFLAIEREPVTPLIATPDGASVLLAEGTFLLIAGPSGIAKSLAALDLLGRLCRPDGGEWLGLTVQGGLRALALVLEGSDDDTRDRLAALVPPAARAALLVVDRWRGAALGSRDLPTLAGIIRRQQTDVLLIDTLAAFFGDQYEIAKGIPEDAFADLERLRRLSGRDFAVVGVAHTRKADRSAGTATDELEEIAGTIGKKADAAVVIRRDGEDGPRRRVRFAKTRRGPEPATVIAALPEPGSGAAPRLRVLADAHSHAVKEGTEAERIAAWVAEQPAPQTAAQIIEALGINERTLRRRGERELPALGLERHVVPSSGPGRPHAWGTPAQWVAAHGRLPSPDSSPDTPPVTAIPDTTSGRYDPPSSLGDSPDTDIPATGSLSGGETPAVAGNGHRTQAHPPTGDPAPGDAPAPEDGRG